MWTIFAYMGLDADQVQCQVDKIAETAQTAGLSVHLVTKESSKDELIVWALFDGVYERASLKSRRI